MKGGIRDFSSKHTKRLSECKCKVVVGVFEETVNEVVFCYEIRPAVRTRYRIIALQW